MAILAERIKECRKSMGLKAEDIAQALGVSRATMYRYESSEEDKIPAGFVDKLANVLGTTREYLMGIDDNRFGSTEEKQPDAVCLPVIGVVRAGVGGITFEEKLGEAAVATSEIKGHSPQEFFWSLVKGDSMEPRLYDGDLILVRKQPSIDSGSYAVVLVDGEEGVVKKVTYDENSITLVSLNEKYPPRTFRGSEVLRIRVVGQVIKSVSSF